MLLSAQIAERVLAPEKFNVVRETWRFRGRENPELSTTNSAAAVDGQWILYRRQKRRVTL